MQNLTAVDAEILSQAQSLYYQGRSIGRKLEGGLQNALLDFYSDALPFAERVQEVRPWLEKEYQHLNDPDPERAFLKFLRASFTETMESMVYHQSVIVCMMLKRGWTISTIEGIGLKRLWRISNTIKELNSEDQQKLLNAAKELPYREFDAVAKSLKRGIHYEPIRDKMISAPKSAMKELDKFLEACKDQGDTRMQGEILADTVSGVMIEDKEFSGVIKEAAIIALLCDIMRFFHRDMTDIPNISIMAEIAKEMIRGYIPELPEYLFKKTEQLMGIEFMTEGHES